MEIVNDTHQGYLSDDVIEKLGVERRGERKVLFSDRESASDVRRQWDEEAKAMEQSHRYDLKEQRKQLMQEYEQKLKDSLDRRLYENAAVTLNTGEIISNSIKINELNPQKDNADSSYVLIGAAISEDGECYLVRSVVNRFSSELTSMDVLYAISAKNGTGCAQCAQGFKAPLPIPQSV